MDKRKIGIKVLRAAEQLLGYSCKEMFAVMTLKDSSRLSTHLFVFNTPEGDVLVNLNETDCTLVFNNESEWNSYAASRFEFYDSEKDMYMDFTGMDEETWNEWNK